MTHWTDSLTVPQWLHSSHKRHRVFGANRVGEILYQPFENEWQHMKGTMNPADISTRGVTVSQLLECDRLNGPAWLKKNPSSYREQAKLTEDEDFALMTNPPENIIVCSRFSNNKRLRNVVVYCLRFRSQQGGVVTALEKKKAQLLILQLTQCERFAELFNKFENNSGEGVKLGLQKIVISDSSIKSDDLNQMGE